jgi:hypothetical protein
VDASKQTRTADTVENYFVAHSSCLANADISLHPKYHHEFAAAAAAAAAVVLSVSA